LITYLRLDGHIATAIL